MKHKMFALLLSSLLLTLVSCGEKVDTSSSPSDSAVEASFSQPESALLPESSFLAESSEPSSEESSRPQLPKRELVDITDKILHEEETPYALRFLDDHTLAMQYGIGDEARTRLFDWGTEETTEENVGNGGIVEPNAFDRTIPLADGRVAFITEDQQQVRIKKEDGSGDTLLLDAASEDGVDAFWILLAKEGIAGVCGNTYQHDPTTFAVNLDTGEARNLAIPGTTIPQCIEGGRLLFVREGVMSAPYDNSLYLYDTQAAQLREIPTGSTVGCCRAVLSTDGDYILSLTEENADEKMQSFAVFDSATGEKVNTALIRELPTVSENNFSFALSPDGSTIAVLSYLYPGDFINCGVFLYRMD